MPLNSQSSSFRSIGTIFPYKRVYSETEEDFNSLRKLPCEKWVKINAATGASVVCIKISLVRQDNRLYEYKDVYGILNEIQRFSKPDNRQNNLAPILEEILKDIKGINKIVISDESDIKKQYPYAFIEGEIDAYINSFYKYLKEEHYDAFMKILCRTSEDDAFISPFHARKHFGYKHVKNLNPVDSLFCAAHSIATIVMYGRTEKADVKDIYKSISNSVLLALEYIRMRWHYLIYANLRLDDVIQKIRKEGDEKNPGNGIDNRTAGEKRLLKR